MEKKVLQERVYFYIYSDDISLYLYNLHYDYYESLFADYDFTPTLNDRLCGGENKAYNSKIDDANAHLDLLKENMILCWNMRSLL